MSPFRALLTLAALCVATLATASEVTKETSRNWRPSDGGGESIDFTRTTNACLVARAYDGSPTPSTVRLFVGATEISAQAAVDHPSQGRITPFVADETDLAGITGSQSVVAWGSGGVDDTLSSTVRMTATLYTNVDDCTPPTAGTSTAVSATTIQSAALTVPAGGVLDVGVHLSNNQSGKMCTWSDSMTELHDKGGHGSRSCNAMLNPVSEEAGKQITLTSVISQDQLLTHAMVLSPQPTSGGNNVLTMSPAALPWDGCSTLTAEPELPGVITALEISTGDTLSVEPGATEGSATVCAPRSMVDNSGALSATNINDTSLTCNVTDGTNDSATTPCSIAATSDGFDKIFTVTGTPDPDTLPAGTAAGDTAWVRVLFGDVDIATDGSTSNPRPPVETEGRVFDVSAGSWLAEKPHSIAGGGEGKVTSCHTGGFTKRGRNACTADIAPRQPINVTHEDADLRFRINDSDRLGGKAVIGLWHCGTDSECTGVKRAAAYTDPAETGHNWRLLAEEQTDADWHFTVDPVSSQLVTVNTGPVLTAEHFYYGCGTYQPDSFRPRNETVCFGPFQAGETPGGGGGFGGQDKSWNTGHYASEISTRNWNPNDLNDTTGSEYLDRLASFKSSHFCSDTEGYNNTRGIKFFVHWGNVEPYVYGERNWKMIDDILESVRSNCGAGNRRVFFILKLEAENRFYKQNRNQGGKSCAPQMAFDRDHVVVSPSTGQTGHCVSALWGEAYPYFEDYAIAFAQRYGDDPLVEGFALDGEGSKGWVADERRTPKEDQLGFTAAAFAAAHGRLVRAVAAAAPKKLVGFGTNHHASFRGAWHTHVRAVCEQIPGCIFMYPDTHSSPNDVHPHTNTQAYHAELNGVIGMFGDAQRGSKLWWPASDTAAPHNDVFEHCCGDPIDSNGVPDGYFATHFSWRIRNWSFPNGVTSRLSDVIDKIVAEGGATYTSGCPMNTTHNKLFFTSGGGAYRVKIGDEIIGDISGATATVDYVSVNQQEWKTDWSSGNVTGAWLFNDQVGTFQAETISIVGGWPDVGTVAGDSLKGGTCVTGEI